jgi:hypothetical protein
MRGLALMGVAGFAVGCTGPEEEAGPPAILSFTVDPATVVAGADTTASVEVENFELTGHHEEGEGGHEHEEGDHDHDGVAVQRGHVHIYLDDVMTNPLLMLVTPEGALTIPVDVAPGAHTLIARLQDEDHKIIEPQVTAEVDIEVLAPDL